MKTWLSGFHSPLLVLVKNSIELGVCIGFKKHLTIPSVAKLSEERHLMISLPVFDFAKPSSMQTVALKTSSGSL